MWGEETIKSHHKNKYEFEATVKKLQADARVKAWNRVLDFSYFLADLKLRKEGHDQVGLNFYLTRGGCASSRLIGKFLDCVKGMGSDDCDLHHSSIVVSKILRSIEKL